MYRGSIKCYTDRCIPDSLVCDLQSDGGMLQEGGRGHIHFNEVVNVSYQPVVVMKH